MTTIKGPDFFDDEARFQLYLERRRGKDTPNATLEAPVLLELLGDIRGVEVLDLGCGDAMFGVRLLEAGAAGYVGLESSWKMARQAAENLSGYAGESVHAAMEDWVYPPETFDLVISRLALHYVADFSAICRQVFTTLRANGRFVFSTIHPVITSSDKSRAGRRQDWTVDNYFTTGPRSVRFMDAQVEQFHRTVEDFFLTLQGVGFTVDKLRESRPDQALFADRALYKRRMRIPLFIFFAASKASNSGQDQEAEAG